MTEIKPNRPPRAGTIRWWPAALLVILASAAIVWVRLHADWPFQKRNLTSTVIGLITAILLVLWWTCFSRARKGLRWGVVLGLIGLVVAAAALFRIRGVSGDLAPVLEFRWKSRALSAAPASAVSTPQTIGEPARASFPQFLGPDRNGVLPGPKLDTNWTAHPPVVVWRQKVGPAWSGFAVVGEVCLTQEQRGEEECVAAYDLATGRQLWQQADPARYHTTIAGEGPRATPTVSSNRVLTCGSTGLLNCFDLATGKRLWTRDVVSESGGKVPEWGFASSPLLVDGRVIVHGGAGSGRLLLAFHAEDGRPAWSGGTVNPSYASPILATLAGVTQVLAFTRATISGFDPATGARLWELPWQSRDVVCSSPVVADSNRVVFSSAYGFGSQLIEIAADATGQLSARQVWKTIRMKSKFGHLFIREHCLFGLDDGILACVDLEDGAQRWKEGRYGHGQGLLVGEFYLLMAESGELVLLRPTRDAPNEVTRFRVFHSKTWNPIALAGDFLLVRNDQEAACLRLKLAP